MSLGRAAAERTRQSASGFGRVLVLVYGIFAVSAGARAVVQLIRDAGEAPLAYGLSALAAVVYGVATVAIAHNGPGMRRLAWGAVVFELLGVLVVGTLSLSRTDLFPEATVWSGYGSGYGFVPLVLPVVGIVWLWRSVPR